MKRVLILLISSGSCLFPSQLPTQYHPITQILKSTFDSADFRANLKNVLINHIKQLTLTPEQKNQAQRLLILVKEGLSFNLLVIRQARRDYEDQRDKTWINFQSQKQKIWDQIVALEKSVPQQVQPPIPALAWLAVQVPENIQEQIFALRHQMNILDAQQDQAVNAVQKSEILQKFHAWSNKMANEEILFIEALETIFSTEENAINYFINFSKEIVDALLQVLQEK